MALVPPGRKKLECYMCSISEERCMLSSVLWCRDMLGVQCFAAIRQISGPCWQERQHKHRFWYIQCGEWFGTVILRGGCTKLKFGRRINDDQGIKLDNSMNTSCTCSLPRSLMAPADTGCCHAVLSRATAHTHRRNHCQAETRTHCWTDAPIDYQADIHTS